MAIPSIPEHVLTLDDLGPDEAPVRKLVNMVVLLALKSRYREVLLEPQGKDWTIACRGADDRIEMMPLIRGITGPVVQRIKVLADLDIRKHRIRQRGRMKFVIGEGEAEIDVLIEPVPDGEKIQLTFETNSISDDEVNDLFSQFKLSLADESRYVSWPQRIWHMLGGH